MPALPAPHGQSTKAAAYEPHDARFETFKKEIDEHFKQETRSKKRIHELEQKQETAKLTIVNKNNEIAELVKKMGAEEPAIDSKMPLETSQSEKIESPVKLNLDAVNNKPDA